MVNSTKKSIIDQNPKLDSSLNDTHQGNKKAASKSNRIKRIATK